MARMSSFPSLTIAILVQLAIAGCGGSSRPAAEPEPHPEGPVRAATDPESHRESAAKTKATDAPAVERGLAYFAGQWEGEFRGTQAFSRLDVADDGTFTFQVQAGPEQRCDLKGRLSVEANLVDMNVQDPPPCAGWSEAKLGKQKLLRSDAHSFDIGDVEYLHAIEKDEDGNHWGPVWAFVRTNR